MLVRMLTKQNFKVVRPKSRAWNSVYNTMTLTDASLEQVRGAGSGQERLREDLEPVMILAGNSFLLTENNI